MKRFTYQVAETLDSALGAHAGGEARLKAAGLDLVDLMQERIETPDTILSLHAVNDADYVREEGGTIAIGCLTTLRDLAENDLLRERFPGLVQAVEHAATPQVRERATLGGNLCQRPRCWYFRNPEFACLKKGGSTCFAVRGENQYHAVLGGGPCHIVHPSNAAVPLVAAQAQLVLRTAGGERTVSASEFFVPPRKNLYGENVLQPGEILTEIRLPEAPKQSATVALREKQSFDWPVAMASVARMSSGWRVGLGALAPVPWLSEEAAALLGTADIDEALAAEAGRVALQAAEPLSSNAHKVRLGEIAVKRALLRAAGIEVPA